MARIGDLLTTLLRRRTPPGDPLADAVLLERFAATRDQAAFELLVWRHGPMVLATCRRVLRDPHAAEDAFQAAFLVLARKAGTVRGSAAGWLHRVALRVCLRMKHRLPPVSLEAEPTVSPDPDAVEAAEQSAILDDEIARLPEWLRLPVILCHLQGHTAEHTAAALGIPRGTVLSRLANARKRLAARLTARGVAPAVVSPAAFTPDLSADAGRTVTESATLFTFGNSAHTVSAQLALEVISMAKRKVAIAMTAAVLLIAGLGTGIGFVAARGQGSKPTPTTDNNRMEELRRELYDLDRRLADSRQAEVEVMRIKVKALEQRYSELVASQNVLAPQRPPELVAAEERLAAATQADVPADVLAEACGSHPQVMEVQKRLTAKEDEVRASKLPKGDAGRKKLDDERAVLLGELQTAKADVGPEVRAYLRAPAVVEAKKAVAAAETAHRRSREQLATEVVTLENELARFRRELTYAEGNSETAAWLKEKRTKVQRELFELQQHVEEVRSKDR